ncbi:MAG: hypothetical protein MI974_31750 [Chitinophagales bacterium]|nr:hypothetical protein [Chitinophagales bacterium]
MKFQNKIYQLLITCLLTFMSYSLYSQAEEVTLSSRIGYEAKRQLLKYHDLEIGIYLNNKFETNKLWSVDDWRNTSLMGFGYLPRFPQIKYFKTPLNFPPDSTVNIYLASFPKENLENQELHKEIQKKTSIVLLNPTFGLLLVDSSLQGEHLLSVMMTGGRQSIASLFDLSPDTPDSYIPFLQSKCFYYSPYSSISYKTRIADTLYFEADFEKPKGTHNVYEVSFTIGQPDKIRTKYLRVYKIPQVGKDATDKRLADYSEPFKNNEEKVKYLKWSLMTNYYLFLMGKKLKGLDSLDLYNHPIRDSLLPDYNQILSRLDHLEYGCCWIDAQSRKALFDKLPVDLKPISRMDGEYQLVTAERRRFHPQIEYYKFFLDTVLWLERIPDPQFSDLGTSRQDSRYDLFYQPQAPPIPPVPLRNSLAESRYLAGCSYGYNYDSIKNHYDLVYRSAPLPSNHYLLALNTETRDVYFLSGKDIYLSESIALYVPPWYEEFNKSYYINYIEPKEQIYERFINSQYVFTYIQDRLYRYLVERLDEDDVIYKDEEKMVLRCQGEEYKEPLELEVTFYYDNPEELEIKVLEQNKN